jgi:hypothetical protein
MPENKKVNEIVRATPGTIYYIAFESSTECTLYLTLNQKESDVINQTWMSN